MNNIPQAFLERIAAYSSPYLADLGEALATTNPEVSVRVNPAKGATVPPSADIVKWWGRGGFYLPERLPFTFDPALHQGLYYVQDASSMAIAAIVSHLTEGGEPLRYLDSCAAPGGKTTAAIDALPAGSLVVANEYDFRRANILAENVAKWGNPRVVVSRGDTSKISALHGFFDIIAADVPCSGEGMMRKDAEAAAQWSPALVAECAARQRQIVDNLWPALRPGGYMIYSTCTFNRDEDEDIVDYIVSEYGAHSVSIPALDEHPEIAPAIFGDSRCYRFIPGRTRGEGLFVCVLQKPEDAEVGKPKKSKQRDSKPKTALTPDHIKLAKSWLVGDYDFRLAADGESLYAVPKDIQDAVTTLSAALDVVDLCLCVGRIKGRDLIPSQQLALSLALNRSAFARVDVDYVTALTYLRRETIPAPEGAPRGFNLLYFDNVPLGFVKNLGNRVNNLYPTQWRILSTYTNEVGGIIAHS
jgi:16S rRNA C967 or C1407 C5-methylase (RsmB/RsmF family)/NOL1/NOP2/fmu family ribosome biogenesis protein